MTDQGVSTPAVRCGCGQLQRGQLQRGDEPDAKRDLSPSGPSRSAFWNIRFARRRRRPFDAQPAWVVFPHAAAAAQAQAGRSLRSVGDMRRSSNQLRERGEGWSGPPVCSLGVTPGTGQSTARTKIQSYQDEFLRPGALRPGAGKHGGVDSSIATGAPWLPLQTELRRAPVSTGGMDVCLGRDGREKGGCAPEGSAPGQRPACLRQFVSSFPARRPAAPGGPAGRPGTIDAIARRLCSLTVRV